MAEVGCVGILVADTFCGPMDRLPPEGHLMAIGPMPFKVGGCAANVAIDLVKQGFDVDVVGMVGRDPAAQVVLSGLKENGVGVSQVTASEAFGTSQTVILLVKGEDRRYLHTFGANEGFSVSLVDREWVKGLRVFYLGGLFAMPGIRTDELRGLLEFCRARGILTVVDVVVPQNATGIDSLRPLLPHVDCFLPNDDEARLITGRSDPIEQLGELRGMGASTVIITLGRKGAVAVSGSTVWQCPAYEAQVVDPSGSGDAFAGGVITGLLRNWKMDRTLRYASALGASATRAVGTTDGVFGAREAEAFVEAHCLAVTSRAMVK
jgi:sugar/nucleoside kinase (ribokinase family)